MSDIPRNNAELEAMLGEIHRDADSLAALLAILRSLPEEHGIAMTELPVFGGKEPRKMDGVWSWDETRLLVGTCVEDMRIVSRDERDARCDYCGRPLTGPGGHASCAQRQVDREEGES